MDKKMEYNDKNKRLLCIVVAMNTGGAETFLMKNFRQLNKMKYSMDFITMIETVGAYDEEIKSLGGKIYNMPGFWNKPIKSMGYLCEIIKREKYDNVLLSSELSVHVVTLFLAKMVGANNCVFRCTNTNTSRKSRLLNVMHSLFLPLARMIPDQKVAPSTEAAEFMFGKDCIKNGNAQILLNGLLLEKFKFNYATRTEKRKQLNISDKVVVGHIGRFSEQKNHKKILNIVKEMCAIESNVVLVLIGVGELENQIKKYAEELKISSRVFFLGRRYDVCDLMQAMDLLLFPSLFEGMPNVVIEAQATGLPCLISDTITKECALTDIVEFKSLMDGDKDWAEKGICLAKKRHSRDVYERFLRKKGYDISTVNDSFKRIMFK